MWRKTPFSIARFSLSFAGKRAIAHAVIYLIALSAFAQFPKVAPLLTPLTLKQACTWCDTVPIASVEGIYACPFCQATLLVRNINRHSTVGETFELVIVETLNPRYSPGQVIGYMQPGGSNDWKIWLYENGKIASKPIKAIWHASRSAFTFAAKKRQMRISVNPMALIPRLGRLLRIIPETQDEPYSETLFRIYPEPSGSPIHIRYF